MPDCGIDLKRLPEAVGQSMARGRASLADALVVPHGPGALSAGSLSGPAPLIYITDLRHTMFNSKIPGLVVHSLPISTLLLRSYLHSEWVTKARCGFESSAVASRRLGTIAPRFTHLLHSTYSTYQALEVH